MRIANVLLFCNCFALIGFYREKQDSLKTLFIALFFIITFNYVLIAGEALLFHLQSHLGLGYFCSFLSPVAFPPVDLILSRSCREYFYLTKELLLGTP